MKLNFVAHKFSLTAYTCTYLCKYWDTKKVATTIETACGNVQKQQKI